MERKSGDGGAKPATRFGFSWADEVEREEREQQQQHHHLVTQQRPEGGKKREQGKPDPFGAARPREVVLAEKGVDWRARDLELHAPAPDPHRSAHVISASARMATPARRRAPWGRDAGGAGRTPHPWRRAADSTPQVTKGRRNAAPVSHSALGGAGKGKCAGEGPAPARRVPPVPGQVRRVFDELNIGDSCGASVWSSAKKSRNSEGSETEGVEATAAVAADGAPSTTMAATGFEESAVGQKRRRGGERRKARGSGKTKKQQT